MDAQPSSTRSRRAVLVAGVAGIAATIASAFGRPEAALAGSDGDVVLGAGNSTSGATSIASTVNNQPALTVTATGTVAGGVYAHSDEYIGVFGGSTSSNGLYGSSSAASGVYGFSTGGEGVIAYSEWPYGPALLGQSATDQIGVYGLSGYGANLPSNSPKIGVFGTANQDYSSIGVAGSSEAGYGVEGVSTSGVGVLAWTESSTVSAGRGYSPNGGTGLHGQSGYVPDNSAPAKTGVYGSAAQDATSRGVFGHTEAGQGVYGEATTGQGLSGHASTGTAVYAATTGPKTGLALRAVGRVKFDNAAGIATIVAGTRSVVVTPGLNLTATSAVVATLQGLAGGTTTVHRAVVNATADTFTIYLTANATVDAKVAWHVFG